MVENDFLISECYKSIKSHFIECALNHVYFLPPFQLLETDEVQDTSVLNRKKRQTLDTKNDLDLSKMGRIVGGFDSVPNSFPWQLFIRINGTRIRRGRRQQFRCGGALLNRKFGISAMHCFWPRNGINIALDNPGRVNTNEEVLEFDFKESFPF